MILNDVRFIQLPKFLDEHGNLSFVKLTNHIPFEIKRFILPNLLPNEQNAYHLFPILVKGKGNRDRLQKYLAENGVGTVIHYPIPPHKQECYAKEIWNTPQLSLPITERLADEELSLPMGPCMSEDDAMRIINIFNIV